MTRPKTKPVKAWGVKNMLGTFRVNPEWSENEAYEVKANSYEPLKIVCVKIREVSEKRRKHD